MLKKIGPDALKRCLTGLAMLAMSLIIMAQSSQLPLLPVPTLEADSEVFQYVALVMKKGGMPYLDTFDHKGPLLYVINYIGLLTGGQWGTWYVELVTIWLGCFAMYKTARLRCGRAGSLLTVMISLSMIFDCFMSGDMAEEFAIPFIAASTYIFLDYMKNGRVTRPRLILCGACFGAVCMLRVNMAVLWVVFCVAILIKCLREKNGKALGGFVAFFLIGAAVVIVPLVVWLAAGHALTACIEQYIVFSMKYISRMPEVLNFWSLSQAKALSFFHFVKIELFSISIILCVFLVWKRRSFTDVTYLVYMLALLASNCVSGMVYEHYAMVFVPAVVYPVAEAMPRGVRRLPDREGLAALAIPLYLTAAVAMPQWLEYTGDAAVLVSVRDSVTYRDSYDATLRFIRENTREDETIAVFSSMDDLYVLTDRMSATKYSYVFPIGAVDPDIMSDYFKELRENPPKLIIVPSGGDEVSMLQRFVNNSPIMDFIEVNGYRLALSTLDFEDGDLRVLIYER